MKYLVTLKYPSGYRSRKEIEAKSIEEAEALADELARKKDKGYFIHAPLTRIVKVESIEEINPPTVRDALMKRWSEDVEAMARRFVFCKNIYGFKTFFSLLVEGTFESAAEAISANAAYLNSPAEVEK